MRRRRLLAATVGLLPVPVAGCTGGGESDEGNGGSATATPNDSSDEATATATASDDELDLREANVVGVEVKPRDDDYRLSVTLIHDDDGEDGYANWWQVETLDGQRFGRRELSHAHGTREFTRSKTVSVPGVVDCVVVRGHDQTHEYGGQAAVVRLDSGATNLVRQGEAASEFDATDCPE